MIGECIPRLVAIGTTHNDALALRRVAMTLHRWHELECGTENGTIERDEDSGRVYWLSYRSYGDGSRTVRTQIPDREKGALARLKAIMARYPKLGYYVQGDPRGASLYILRPGDVPKGEKAESYYPRGIAVYK